MKKLYYLLINLKIGLKHHNTYIRCYQTRLIKNFLYLLTNLSLIEGFNSCPHYKYKYLIFLSTKNLSKKYSYNSYKIWNICFFSSIFNFQNINKLTIYIKPSKIKILKHKKIKKLRKSNTKSIYILANSQGYMLLTEALFSKLGGILLCKFDI